MSEKLERKILASEARDTVMGQESIREYAYNAMAKYAVLGEKPTKWVFQRASAPPTMTVDALEDN
ncbi:hypothetical protein E4U46_000859, partial [Claviceps purpurea]